MVFVYLDVHLLDKLFVLIMVAVVIFRDCVFICLFTTRGYSQSVSQSTLRKVCQHWINHTKTPRHFFIYQILYIRWAYFVCFYFFSIPSGFLNWNGIESAAKNLLPDDYSLFCSGFSSNMKESHMGPICNPLSEEWKDTENFDNFFSAPNFSSRDITHKQYQNTKSSKESVWL